MDAKIVILFRDGRAGWSEVYWWRGPAGGAPPYLDQDIGQLVARRRAFLAEPPVVQAVRIERLVTGRAADNPLNPSPVRFWPHFDLHGLRDEGPYNSLTCWATTVYGEVGQGFRLHYLHGLPESYQPYQAPLWAQAPLPPVALLAWQQWVAVLTNTDPLYTNFGAWCLHTTRRDLPVTRPHRIVSYGNTLYPHYWRVFVDDASDFLQDDFVHVSFARGCGVRGLSANHYVAQVAGPDEIILRTPRAEGGQIRPANDYAEIHAYVYDLYPIKRVQFRGLRIRDIGRRYWRYSWAPIVPGAELAVHPCGKAMDYLRSGYFIAMRTYQAGVDPVACVWFRVADNTPLWRTETPFRSLNWHEPHRNFRLGEQLPYNPDCRFDPPPWYDGHPPAVFGGQTACGGPDAWRDGGQVSIDPPVVIPPSLVPDCCRFPGGGQRQGAEDTERVGYWEFNGVAADLDYLSTVGYKPILAGARLTMVLTVAIFDGSIPPVAVDPPGWTLIDRVYVFAPPPDSGLFAISSVYDRIVATDGEVTLIQAPEHLMLVCSGINDPLARVVSYGGWTQGFGRYVYSAPVTYAGNKQVMRCYIDSGGTPSTPVPWTAYPDAYYPPFPPFPWGGSHGWFAWPCSPPGSFPSWQVFNDAFAHELLWWQYTLAMDPVSYHFTPYFDAQCRPMALGHTCSKPMPVMPSRGGQAQGGTAGFILPGFVVMTATGGQAQGGVADIEVGTSGGSTTLTATGGQAQGGAAGIVGEDGTEQVMTGTGGQAQGGAAIFAPHIGVTMNATGGQEQSGTADADTGRLPVTFIGTATGGPSTQTLDLDWPSGVQEGDRLYAWIASEPATLSWSGPSGWTQEFDAVAPGGLYDLTLWRYDVPAGGSGPSTWTGDTLASLYGSLWCIRYDSTTVATGFTSGTGTTASVGPISSAAAGDIFGAAVLLTALSETSTPSGWTLVDDLAGAVSELGTYRRTAASASESQGASWSLSVTDAWATGEVCIGQ